jgi:hypothetical protein
LLIFQIITLTTLHFIYKSRDSKTGSAEANATVYHKLSQFDADLEEDLVPIL